MKNKKVIFILLFVIIVGTGIFIFKKTNSNETQYIKISSSEAKEIIDNDNGVIIVDVRTNDEYVNGHIEGAVCIPNETISKQISDLIPDKKQEILVYCRSGNRSRQAAYKLIDLGYKNVKDFGGIIDWPYEIIE